MLRYSAGAVLQIMLFGIMAIQVSLHLCLTCGSLPAAVILHLSLSSVIAGRLRVQAVMGHQ